MHNNSASKAIDQAEKIITDIFENGTHDKDTGEGFYRAITLIADVRSAISDIDVRDVSEILCHALDIAEQLKLIIDLYHGNLEQEQTETTEFVASSLFSKLAHELYREVKTASSLC